MITVRAFEEGDWPAIWTFIEPVFRAGETYGFPTDISELDAHHTWIEYPRATYVAVDESGAVLGTYYLKPNMQGPGAHVCNCGYITSAQAQGKGVATLMCKHSQGEAVRLGFRAMQFNLVASSNAGAVRLWQKLGYGIVGTLPAAFKHPALGYVDAYVMFKQLTE